MTAPIRIQRQRTKGCKMPDNTVYVGRPTRWGNPFRIGQTHMPAVHPSEVTAVKSGPFTHFSVDGRPGIPLIPFDKPLTPEDTVALFRGHAMEQIGPASIREALRGKNLACFCALDQPCHADVLLELANAPACTEAP